MIRLPSVVAVVLLLAACSARDGLIDRRTLDCSPGQEISIRAGVIGAKSGMELGSDLLEFGVELSNNSHRQVVVRSIRVDQVSDERSRYQITPVQRRFDQVIDEGEDHLFELPMDGRYAGGPLSRPSGPFSVLLAVTVFLEDGDSYRCSFSVPVPG